MATLAQIKEALAASKTATETKPSATLGDIKSAITAQQALPNTPATEIKGSQSFAPVNTDIPQLDTAGDILPPDDKPFTEGRDVEQDFRNTLIPPSVIPQVSLQLKGMGFGVEALRHGGEELIRATMSVLPGVDVVTDYKQKRINRNKVIDKYASNLSERDQSILGSGKMVGQFGPLFLVNPATAAGRITTGGTTSLALPTEGDNPHLFTQERTMNLIVGTGGSAALEGLFKTGRALIGKSKDGVNRVTEFFTRSGGEKVSLRGVKPEAVKESLATTERLGVKPLTPGESSMDDAVIAREATSIRGLRADDQLATSQTNIARDESMSKVIVDSINRIVPEGDVVAAKQLKELYTPAFQTPVPLTTISSMSSNPLYQKALKSMQSRPSTMDEFNALPDGSLGQVELVRREISSVANSMSKSIESTTRAEARGWQELNKSMKTSLAGLSPEYKMALPLAQRMIVKKRIIKDLEKLPTEAKPDGVSVFNTTPNQFFKQILGTTEKRKELSRQLGNVIGAEKRMDDLAFILARMDKGPMKAISGESDRLIQGGTMGQGSAGVVVTNVMAFMRGRHNLAMVELITNGKWANALAKTRKIKDPKEQLEALTVVLTTVMADNIAEMKQAAREPILESQQ
jgi:hypothetical protein